MRQSPVVIRRGRNLEKISERFLFKKARHPPLDACRVRAYKAGHDETHSDHYSNYMPGALTLSSRRDFRRLSHRAAPDPQIFNTQ